MTKFSTYRSAILFALAGFLSLVCAHQTKAQATITLNTGNTAIAGDTGPYATVTITLDSSTTASVTFNSLTNGGFIYLMGDGGTADLNVNGTYTLGTVTESNSISGGTPSFKDNTPGTVDGFGSFNLSLNNNSNSFTDSATSISFMLTDTSGTWSSASNVLTPNGDGYLAAIHADPCSTPCTTSSTYPTTGYASGGPITVTPEPKSMLLFGTGLLILGGIVRRRGSLKT